MGWPWMGNKAPDQPLSHLPFPHPEGHEEENRKKKGEKTWQKYREGNRFLATLVGKEDGGDSPQGSPA